MSQPFETAVSDFVQSMGMMVRRIRAASASQELSLTESAVLGRLDREGPATTADLARAEGMKPQSMGAAVAALQARGLVTRKPHPSDGRQWTISLTARGRALRETARAARRTWLAHAVAGLSRQEQATLFAAGEILRRLARS